MMFGMLTRWVCAVSKETHTENGAEFMLDYFGALKVLSFKAY